MNRIVTGVAAAALAAGLIGVAAGTAQAQYMPRAGHAAQVVQPATRDMAVNRDCSSHPYLAADGVRIRATPGGTILALAYTSDDYQLFFPAYGNTWYMSDMTRHVTGYIAAQFVDWSITPTCPA
ncbi:hypothetical protein [Kutzneria sp. 744]|uniref:hypothetical protein n=1 Tax=Kutzneria sp. (strain 744) TaxID=345341 RepID=UPI0003EEC51F|nr:hypothetical protein [Kutzneria sp. 744]EWM19773.1 hypothetical protein KUTG_10077 [Kutzneria sp. 744]